MTEKSKEASIKRIYGNPVTGYGYINVTFQQAKKVNPDIKCVDAKESI